MNENDWKIDDNKWREVQEKKWPYIEKKISISLIDFPEHKKANHKLGLDFLRGVRRELPRKEEMPIMVYRYSSWILMHPNPTEENIRFILNDFVNKGYTSGKLPSVQDAMELSGHCEDLVEKGLVDSAVVEAFMDVVYGQSIEDTIRINQLDFDEVAVKMLKSYFSKILIWFFQKSRHQNVMCLFPIDRWIKLVFSLLIKVEDKHVGKTQRAMKRFFNFLTNFEDERDSLDEIDLVSIPRNRDLIFKLRSEIVGSKDSYCRKLREYVVKLEKDLETAGISWS